MKVHYQVDWLINGGPNFDSVCQKSELDPGEFDDVRIVGPLLIDEQRMWFVVGHGYVFAEGTATEMSNYLLAYMIGVNKWCDEQEDMEKS